MFKLKDINDFYDIIDHYSHWGTIDERRRIWEQIRKDEDYRRIFIGYMGKIQESDAK